MVELGASDLHIRSGSPAYFRVDGRLIPIEGTNFNTEDVQSMLESALSSRHKAIFEETLEIDFSFSVRGSARFRCNGYREKGNPAAVIRRVSSQVPDFETLHLPPSVKTLADQKWGLVLVTGPTGHGKSTTLASIVEYINQTRSCHIVTIEDPVEFMHEDRKSIISQRELGSDTLSFGEALKHVLRQDPNVILVGEIRDRETADLAIQASLTGHLVFATLHTNDSAGALPRLLDMGAEPFLLTSSITAIVAQRVLRKIDDRGKSAYDPDPKVLADMQTVLGPFFPQNKKIQLFKGVPTPENNNSGYLGRVAIFEVLPVTTKIGHLILTRAPANEIESEAVKEGMITLKQDGFLKTIEGLTTIEEVLRVAQE